MACIKEESYDKLTGPLHPSYNCCWVSVTAVFCPSPHFLVIVDEGCGIQEAYKQELQDLFGISFNRLFCLNNMPIKRYADYLLRQGQLGEYLQVQTLVPHLAFCCGRLAASEQVLRTQTGACRLAQQQWSL